MNTLSQIIDNEDMQRITTEFSRLGDRCYLENAGSSLYPQCLIKLVNEDLTNSFYMNPHSDKYTRDCIEQIRCLILKHFNTDSSNYTVVFTSGCTQSLKLIVEAFQFANTEDDASNCGSFVYLQDNHTSVLGLREIAVQKTKDVIHISHTNFLKALKEKHVTPWKDRYKNDGNTLLAYPAQSNFNGFKYPIDCIECIKDGCLNNYIMKHLCKINCNWYILLDAATYVSTNKLDLSKDQPDFVCLSFYKIFGFPTGLGAILIKNSTEAVLNQKRYFGGGTVDVVLSSENFHVKRENLHERFEDGTVPFLSIIALKHCFDTMQKLIPKVVHNDIMDTISLHTFCLARDLYNQLSELRHPNGCKAAVLYMDSDFSNIKQQGGHVTFNLLRQDGSYIGYAEFQHMADLFNINVRTGCFCNSGSCQRHLMASNKEIKDMYKLGHKCGDELDLVCGKPTGAVRVSFGYFNTFIDVDKLMLMIGRCFVKGLFKMPKRQMLNYKAIETLELIKVPNGDVHQLYNNGDYFTNDTVESPRFDNAIQLKEIAIFPVKSCGAFKIRSAWKIGPKGFEYDREWMIIKDNGVCLTQKQNTRMCMIKPQVDVKNNRLVLNFQGKSPIAVPLESQVQRNVRNTSLCQSKICTDLVKGYDCGDDVAQWISEACEVSFLRLIRQSENDGRTQKKKNENGQKLLSLTNQAQYLLINKATVRWLHDKICDPQFTDDIDNLTDRFRGNIIIDMETELAELDWNKLIIGVHEFKFLPPLLMENPVSVVDYFWLLLSSHLSLYDIQLQFIWVEGQCPRCQMVCIDQKTGEKTVEPLRTISEQFAGKLRFGIYLSYLGTIDGTKLRNIKTSASVKPILNDDDISR